MSNQPIKLLSIIVAGGSGQRMCSHLPKQFIELDGRPILIRTLEHYMSALGSLSSVENCAIVLVLPNDHHIMWRELCIKHNFITSNLHLVAGGATRFDSVLNGLDYCQSNIIRNLADTQSLLVSIHDGVRPFITPSIMSHALSSAHKFGSGVTSTNVVDSLRMLSPDGIHSHSLLRSQVRAVQTPQVFRFCELYQAYLTSMHLSRDIFTDDASVLESQGALIHLSSGEWFNIKVTTPSDLAAAEYILKNIYPDNLSLAE